MYGRSLTKKLEIKIGFQVDKSNPRTFFYIFWIYISILEVIFPIRSKNAFWAKTEGKFMDGGKTTHVFRNPLSIVSWVSKSLAIKSLGTIWLDGMIVLAKSWFGIVTLFCLTKHDSAFWQDFGDLSS